MTVGPCGISSRVTLTDVPLEEGMVLSDGKLLLNELVVYNTNTVYLFNDSRSMWLQF